VAGDLQRILARNSIFYRDAPDDKTEYHVGPETIAGLTWALLNVVVPILVGAASKITADVVKDKLSRKKESEITKADLVELIELWKEAQLDEKPDPAAAVTKVTVYLMHHGWPVQEAEKDARRIVDLVVKQLLSAPDGK